MSISIKSKEHKHSFLNGLSLKEDSENLIVEGYIATDHVDDVGDYIPKSTLQKLADRVNRSSQANKISMHHDRSETTMAGVMKNARLQQTEDGHWGVMVEATVNPAYPDYASLSKEIEIGTIDGFSIEYETNSSHPQLMQINGNNKEVRVLDDITIYGAGWASRPINDQAKITNHTYKEFINLKEVSKMKQKEETPEVEATAKEEIVEEKTEEVKNDDSTESQSEDAPKEEPEEVSEEKEFKAFKEMKKKAKEKEALTLNVKEIMRGMQPVNQPIMQTGNNLEKKEVAVEVKGMVDSYKKATIECKEWKADGGIMNRTGDINLQLKKAAKMYDHLSKIYPQGIKAGSMRSGKESAWDSIPDAGLGNTSDCGLATQSFEVKEDHWKNLEIKGANPFATTTSQLSDSAHYMAAPELSDVFDPVIYNMLNDKTTFYGLLKKVDASKYSYAYEWRSIYGAAAVDGALAEGGQITPDSTDRIILRQPFKSYYGAVNITGQMISAAKGQGAMGNILAIEVKDVTRALLRDMNSNLLVGLEDGSNDGNEAMGLTYVCEKGTTYTDLYIGNSRSTYKLEGNSEAASSANITKGRLRKAFRACEAGDSSLQANNGGLYSSADKSDLLIVTHHIQKDKILATYDDAQRFTSVSARAGFEGLPTFDGVPIHADNQCTSSVLFVVDMRHTFLAVQVPPTYTAWGKRYQYDEEGGFIKTYFNLVCTKPGNNYMCTGLATA